MSKVVEVNNDPHGTKAHPFGEGIGQALRSVHWSGGPFLGLFAQQDTGADEDQFLMGTGTVGIPGHSFEMFDGGTPSIGGPDTVTLTTEDVKTKFPTAFSMSWAGNDAFGGKHLEQLIVLDISSLKKPFTQTFHLSMPAMALIPARHILTSFANFIWTAKQWKKGVDATIEFFTFALPPSTDDNGRGISIGAPSPAWEIDVTFTIDPKNKTITFVSQVP